mgnify:CR=1 FL=1
MPHTWIVWVHAQKVHSHIAIQEMSAVRHPTVLKTSTFSCKDNENTFNMSAIYPNSTTKLKIFSETNNTLRGTLQL